MIKSLRLLAAAAAVQVTIGSGVAAAQTVMVRHAPAGETIELFLNETQVATATVDPSGDTTLPLNLRENNAGKKEIDANVYVDVCDARRRVIVVERGQPAAAIQPGCNRRDVAGLYLVRPVNTLVLDLGGTNPTMMLIKGEFSLEPQRTWGAPGGLVAFGGGGFTAFRDQELIFCGTSQSCSRNSGVGYTAGATLWFKRFIGVEGSYVKPQKVTASGSGDTSSFSSTLDVDVATVAGVVGIPIGPVRLFGKGGANYQSGTATTKQTIKDQSQTFEVTTRGWGWLFGGGLEVWVAPAFGLYVDAGLARLKGKPEGGGEAFFDDRMRFITVGARVRIGR